MDRLAKLRRPLSEMTNEEVHELIRKIRADRRLTKERPSVKVKKARAKDKDKMDLAKLLEGLSPKEIAELFGGTGDDADQGSAAQGNQDQGQGTP
jgi:hypothetical protein